VNRLLFVIAVCISLNGCGSPASEQQPVKVADQRSVETITVAQKPIQVSSNWQLVWQDEFDGHEIDKAKWSFEINCFGGGNNETQCYTDRSTNAYINNHTLVIEAIREDYTGPAAHDDSPEYDQEVTRKQPYTSARLRSKYKGDWKYGRFEISAKLPQGQGTWPAIWMLPTDWVYGGWAGSGEIDIMEAVNLGAQSDAAGASAGDKETRVHGTLHYGRAWPDNVYSGIGYALPDDVNPADDFHVYAIEWQAGEIRWYVDDIHYATQRADGWYTQYHNSDGQLVTGEGAAPFDQPFHLLLNFAVGGDWPANVNDKGVDESVFPQTFEIDYVRVYQCSLDTNTGKGCEAIDDKAIVVQGHTQPAI